MTVSLNPNELTLLQTLAAQYPTIDSALSEAAALRAALSLPKGVIHIVSDVHGEYKKLRHVINNASGSLRPMVESLFSGKLREDELRELIAVLYYPHELMHHLETGLSDSTARRVWVLKTLRRQFEIVRELARCHRRQHVIALMPSGYREFFEELLNESFLRGEHTYIDAMIETLAAHSRDLAVVRAASRLIRNLSISEIIVAGDLGDRGPRLDMVIDYLMQQPTVSFAWGNHDASWMGACLGQEALIATVLRISLRYRRLSQLEEGYGLMVSPLEKLARTVYADDPAECFRVRGSGLRDDLQMARMHKAAAMMQFKLEGQTSRRHPDWGLDSRQLLHRINPAAGTVDIDGRTYSMRDTNFPTLDPGDPYALSAEERACMDRLRQSFVTSRRLWEHLSFVARRGAMRQIRDHTLIFHGCVPVDPEGSFLSLRVDGAECSGRNLFAALESVVRRAFRKGAATAGEDADWFWYLWSGPLSPLFGKDKMTTFENYFIEDKNAREETKNPYFQFINEADFCRRVATDMGVDGDALIVNGHVPVRVDNGEDPVKRGGNAVTIDGAFSEAYGDRGYTLILAPDRIALAEHHHFESIEGAITSADDIVPKVTTIRAYPQLRLIADTEEGAVTRHRISALELLITAYEEGVLHERKAVTY